MKKAIQYIIVIFLLTQISCGEDTSLRGKMEGKWIMTRVLDRSQDVTKSHNPENNRWVRFILDDKIKNGGVFESGRGDIRDNTGKWTLNGFELFIDSDAGDNDDSYWQVIIEGDEMHCIGQRFDFNKRFDVFYKRTD